MDVPGLEDFLEKHTGAFEEESGVTVEYEIMGWGDAFSKQLSSISSQSGPDVEEIASTWLPQQLAAEGWMDISSVEGAEVDFDRFFDPTFQIAEHEGSLVGAPWYWGPKGHLVYEPPVQEAGIDGAPGTWDELVAQGEQFRQTHSEANLFGLTGQSVGVAKNFATFLWQNGGELLSEDSSSAAFNSDPGVEALNFWKDLIVEHEAMPQSAVEWDSEAVRSAFLDGRIASAWDSLSTVNQFTDQEGVSRDDFSMNEPPAGPNGDPSIFFGLELIGIHPWTESPEASAMWLEYMSRPAVNAEWAQTVGLLPTVEAAFEEEGFQGHLFQSYKNEVLPVADTFPQVVGWGEIENALTDAASDVIVDAATGEWSSGDTRQALDDAAEQADNILEEEAS